MPIDTLSHVTLLMKNDSTLSCAIELDTSNRKEETNRQMILPLTPTTNHLESFVTISPENSSISSNSSEGSLEDEESFKTDSKPVITDHKLAELAGNHLPEPLLMENPGRFVLFPIQDNEVRCMTEKMMKDLTRIRNQ